MVAECLWRDEESFTARAELVLMDSGVEAVVQCPVGGLEVSSVAGVADVFVAIVVDDQ